MIVHIFENTPHHYHNMMVFFYNRCISLGSVKDEHIICILSSGVTRDDIANRRKLELSTGLNTIVYGSIDDLREYTANYKNNQFIFHSLLSGRTWFSLLKGRFVTSSHWICWGADLYSHVNKKTTFKRKIKLKIQSVACKRMASVKCLNPGDADLLKCTLGREMVDVLPYPLIDVDVPDLVKGDCIHGKVKLLLGNSAAPSNNHFDLIDKVKNIRCKNIEFHMPLNYSGDKEYVDKVLAYGRKNLGIHFVPTLKMLKKVEYDNLLSDMDGAVFAHDRQQGLYVAYFMMLTGKKLFLKRNTTSYDNFKYYGFEVNTLEEISDYNFNDCREDAAKKNQRILIDNFTEDALSPKWTSFFECCEKSSRI